VSSRRPAQAIGTFMIEPMPRLKMSAWSAKASCTSAALRATNTSPRSSTARLHGVLHLAAADGISGRVAAIDALDFVGSLVHAHQCEEAMADHLLYEGVDRGVK